MHQRALVIVALALAGAAGCDGVADGPVVGARQDPVIGGQPTPAGLHPATGALMASMGGGPEFFCTGTLVAPDVVLTAAHCLDDLFLGGQIPGFTLVLDANAAQESDVVPGASKHPHPDFDLFVDPGPGLGKFDDIGVLILQRPIDGVAYELLPGREEGALLTAGMVVDIVGYGMTNEAVEAGGVKHHATTSLKEVGQNELWIASAGEPQNCRGDSGGPAFVDVGLDGGRRLVGIVSRGPDEGCSMGGIDTRVDAYLDWIHSVTDLPCGSGLSPACEMPDGGPGGGDGGGGGGEGGCGCRVGGVRGDAGAAALAMLGLALVSLGAVRASGRRKRASSPRR